MAALLIAVLLSISGLAVAQQAAEQAKDTAPPSEVAQATEERATEEGGDEEGQDPATIGDRLPPQAGSDSDEVPAPLREGWTGGIPEWAGDDGGGGPPFMRDEYDTGWRPGSGEPPWAGTGEGPPWAGQDGDD
ncbi:MAG TPA: hypothetical protein VM470_06475 [Acidimicrobiia bacterium]|nr:hypothetical protein [Acidimicrobiia bacterium]